MVYINNNKLETVKFDNNDFAVIIDFDKTLTPNTPTNSWSVLENPNFIPKELIQESNTLYKKYYPYENNYSISKEEKDYYMETWYRKNIDLFYKYDITYNTLITCVKNSDISFRKGALEFLKTLYKNNIPVVILSAGIGNVIEETLKLNNCYFNNIYILSNFLKFNGNNIIDDNMKIIHSQNKDIYKLPSNILKRVTSKNNFLVCGDLIEDLAMIPEEYRCKTLSVGFLDVKIAENLSIYNSNFDIVLTDNASFNELEDLIYKKMP